MVAWQAGRKTGEGERNMGQAQKGPGRVWKVAFYIRLSREDGSTAGESESVSNQRAILQARMAQMDDGDQYLLAGEYIDDGISGTTDDERADFQRMLEDITLGRVNCVMVKDLARSFRNYSDQGYYLDDWFPRHSVRFISLYHQSLDSYKEPQSMRSIAVPIQGVLNENHCAETSDKVRQVLDMKRRKGEHIGSFAPYGYCKAPGNKNALVIDPEAAQVVREIFALFLSGMSKNAIVRHLNDHGILCPAAYKRERQGLAYCNPSLRPDRRPLWCAVTVGNILKNPMYQGDMVQGRYRMKSYKVHIQESVPRDQWYIMENTHTPIVDRETFAQVQSLLARHTRTGPGQEGLYPFSGLLTCGDCGRAMARSQVGERVYYYCRTYKDQSKDACTKHTLREENLEKAVLFAVRKQIDLGVDAAKVLEQLDKTPPCQGKQARLLQSIGRNQEAADKIARYRQALYQDLKDGLLTREDYLALKTDYDRQTRDLGAAREQLERELAQLESAEEAPVLAEFRGHRNLTVLERDWLIRLVEKITVYEQGRIVIRFRFSPNGRQ